MSDATSTPWFGISMALFGIIVGYIAATALQTPAAAPSENNGQVVAAPNAPQAPAPTPEADDVVPVDEDIDHIRGDLNATISIIEYSDFECPFCSRHHPTVKQVMEDNDDVNWVYRHFPLSFHPAAQPLAEASECVADLGGNDAFWTFTDLVFEEGASTAKIEEYANAAGVDGAKVRNCVDNGTFAQDVKDEMASGSAAGVTGTPGNIIINNETGETRLVSGAQPAAALQAAIDALR